MSGHYSSSSYSTHYPPASSGYPPPPSGYSPPSSTKHASSAYSHHRGAASSHHASDARYHPYSSAPSTSSRYPSAYGASTSSAYGASRDSGRSSRFDDRGRSRSRERYGDRRGGGASRYGSDRGSGRYGDRGGGGGGRGKAPRNEFGIAFGQPGGGLSAPDWSRLELSKFQKNFYREAAAISAQSESEVVSWRRAQDIIVNGSAIPRPIRTFGEAGFPAYIMAEIERAGFVRPTAIQSQGWPMAMSGRDVIGVAETGSGKTLAFLLPCIVHINAQPLLRAGDGPIVLVIAPTRELAMQIEAEVAKFAYSSKIKHCCVYGGVPKRTQASKLREGVEIVICTPGRLLDFLEGGTTNLRRVTYLVIDEADRLLDMGFEPQLNSILSQVRPDRQVLMWSATWPKEVQSLSAKYFSRDVIQVSVGAALSDLKANHDVTQLIDADFDSAGMAANFEKERKLYAILRDARYREGKILIFSATKRNCDAMFAKLQRDGFRVTVIHGDKQQYERDSALESFKTGRRRILIATDVASRGIHVNDIQLVLNYDFPGNVEDYVHRIGRTGRCGNKGTAISFFTRDDAKRAAKLVAILEEAKQVVPPKLKAMVGMASSSFGGGGGGYGGHRRYGR